MSKGSGRRPKRISQQEYEDNWERVFNKKEKPQKERNNVAQSSRR